jgi:hypothetical protein
MHHAALSFASRARSAETKPKVLHMSLLPNTIERAQIPFVGGFGRLLPDFVVVAVRLLPAQTATSTTRSIGAPLFYTLFLNHFQSSSLASFAPADNVASFAHAISG